MEYLYLVIGLVLILAGANFLTDGSAFVACRYKVPEFVIGLTIVAIGTSLPEYVVSMISAVQGNYDAAIGNVVGSNLFNTLVILGVCSLIMPLSMNRGNMSRDIPYVIFSSLLLVAIVALGYFGITTQYGISRLAGVVMLVCYFAIMYKSVKRSRKEAAAVAEASEPSSAEPVKDNMLLAIVMIMGGLVALILGGEMFVNNAMVIAERWGVSKMVISITLLAGGTSLPELASSVVAVVKGKQSMALGNIVGSNLANILLILGSTAAYHPLEMSGIGLFDVSMVFLSAAMLFTAGFTLQKSVIDRWEGAIFLLVYVIYIYSIVCQW